MSAGTYCSWEFNFQRQVNYIICVMHFQFLRTLKFQILASTYTGISASFMCSVLLKYNWLQEVSLILTLCVSEFAIDIIINIIYPPL